MASFLTLDSHLSLEHTTASVVFQRAPSFLRVIGKIMPSQVTMAGLTGKWKLLDRQKGNKFTTPAKLSTFYV